MQLCNYLQEINMVCFWMILCLELLHHNCATNVAFYSSNKEKQLSSRSFNLFLEKYMYTNEAFQYFGKSHLPIL